MKKSCALLCLVLSAALLCSCRAPGAEVSDSGSSLGVESPAGGLEDVDLTLWTFPVGNWGNPTTVSNLLTSFHKEYPSYHITVEYLNYDTGDERIAQALQDGSAPDLVLEGPERLVANWGEKGWMVDLTDLWESERAGPVYDNVKAACQLQGGAYYEFPICMSAHCMAINYDMFQAAGALRYIDEETHTWTTEGFIEAVYALTAYGQETAGVLYCKNQSGDQGTRALVNNLYGGTFTDDAHTHYTIDSEENKRALQLLYDLEGIAFDPSLTAAEAIELFCKGESAMCFCWNASVEIQQTINNPDLNFEVFPMAFPTDQGAPSLEGGIWGFGIFDNGDGKKIEAAKTFIRYMTENEAVYTRAVLASSYWPVREMDNIYTNDMLMLEYSIFTPYMGGYQQITPGWADARTAWWRMLVEISTGTDVSAAVKDFPSPS